ncbi:1-acyl-sn-glycerol-3-phosphate acyltransferase [uncultured Legionella sp.]|uniref:1-acyl-sn-glycerol-3-phosphate acyltransferase n=1 Tax=uncultured Legionella sp. TaxID=210934 RepID=UPI00260833EC|nr:1-acyl-sn-glycerol-3-phosphate acyltransferase [uncultured Legionella sp.]
MQSICKFIYKIFGWKIVGELPKDKKFIIIVAPHTSNWDFITCLCARFIVGVKVNFLAKNQLFFFPFGLLLRAIGGAPVDRSKKGNKVETVVELFRNSDEFRLALAPEGTRSPVTRWKEGFYHIACKAGLPIVMLGPDYASKEIRIQEPFWPSGDIDADFPKILEFFRTIKGYKPKEIPDYHPKNK